ncbi:MAG: nucleoside triphosphate pyrophosphohydrolase, partial [Deltaproteobacteria bacterium]|nr:nucleoside triphosphate pyrophosphohydrolase [Deltaproteobacteria bacterium]
TEKASRVGFDWPSAREVWTKVQEELAELKAGIESADRARIGEELGDLLLTLVNLSRLVAVDPEDALQQATRKFERRFRTMEQHFRAQNRHLRDATLAEMDAVWDAVKADGG